MPRPPSRLRKVPAFILEGLQSQVRGDWSRVTVDEHGAVTVHNQPQVEDPPARPRRAPAREVGEHRPTPAVLAGLPLELRAERHRVTKTVDKRPVAPREPVQRDHLPKPTLAPTSVETPAPAFRPRIVAPPPPPVWIRIPGVNQEGDWERVGVGRTSHQLSKQLRHGLPEQVPIKVNTEVLAMDGVDVDAAVAVVRHPEQVKINEESAKKKYPILTFHRGDITVVLGFREPHEPFMMAAYFTGEALKEYQRSRATGGGGARKGEGVPTRPDLLRRRLVELGASVDEDRDSDADGKTATVTFHGQVLGQIALVNWTKVSVGNDWQRMQRKIHAIKQREESRRGVV